MFNTTGEFIQKIKMICFLLLLLAIGAFYLFTEKENRRLDRADVKEGQKQKKDAVDRGEGVPNHAAENPQQGNKQRRKRDGKPEIIFPYFACLLLPGFFGNIEIRQADKSAKHKGAGNGCLPHGRGK